ncbi:MAG: hypothetical protein AAF502_02280 [Bacteroidota bacterium]
MRTLVFLFVAIFFLSENGYSQLGVKTLDTENLRGDIEKVIESKFKWDEESGGFISQKETIKKFDSEGNLMSKTLIDYPTEQQMALFGNVSDMEEIAVEMELYNYQGKLKGQISKSVPPSRLKDHYTTYEYNTSGQLLQKKKTSQNTFGGTTSEYKVFTYDSEGKKLSMVHYIDEEKPGSFFRKEKYTHAGNATTASVEEYRYGKSEVNRYLTEVYKNDQLISATIKNKDGKSSETVYSYQDGNLILKETNTPEGKTYGFKNEYSNNVLVKKVQTYLNGSTTLTLYDNYGNQTSYTSTNAKGEESSKTKNVYQYDDNGNWLQQYYEGLSDTYYHTREIYYRNGKKVGTLAFDDSFITNNGDVKTAQKVEVKKPSSANTKPSIRSEKWDYTLLKENFRSTQAPAGKIALSTTDGTVLDYGSLISLTIEIPVQPTKVLNYDGKVVDYHYSNEEKYHLWSIRPEKSEEAVLMKLKIPEDPSQSRELMVLLNESVLEFIIK